MKLKSLSPSSAHRWFVCAGSAWAQMFAPVAETEDERNISMEGSAAHKLLETSIKSKKDPLTYVGKTVRLSRPPANWEVNEDMAEHISVGWLLVQEQSRLGRHVKVWSEQRVEIRVLGVACGGTLDVGWYGQFKNDDGKWEWQLHLLDLKYGYKEVDDPGKNKQLSIYTASILRRMFEEGKKVDTIHMWIYQPRVADGSDALPFKHDTLSPDDIHAFELELHDAVKAAMDPKAERTPGPHCLNCGALATCAEAEKATFRAVRRKYREGDRQRIGDLLFELPQISAWMKAVKELGLSMGMHNEPPEGWVLGQGRRSKRWQGDKADWFSKIGPKLRSLGFKENDYAPRKLVSPARAMALAGKDEEKRSKMEKLWFWTQGKPALQPASNARRSLNAREYFEEHDYGDDDE